MPYYLGIDTSISGAFVALFQSEGSSHHVIDHKHFHPMFGSSSALPDIVHEIKSKAGVSKFSGLLLSTGPGSFTGIKVGISFAKGMLSASPETGVLQFNMLLSCGELLAEERGQPVSLVLPATRTHGYAVLVQGGEVMRCELVIRENNFVLSSTDSSFVYSNPVMMTAWPKGEEFGECFSDRELSDIMLKATMNLLQNSKRQDFVSMDEVVPLYMREAAPVERKRSKN